MPRTGNLAIVPRRRHDASQVPGGRGPIEFSRQAPSVSSIAPLPRDSSLGARRLSCSPRSCSRLWAGRDGARVWPAALCLVAAILLCGLVSEGRAEVLRTYGFRPLGDIPDFIPSQLAYTADGELQVYGTVLASNGRRTLARWTEATGAVSLIDNPAGNFFVTDVSDGGTVVVGKSGGSEFDGLGDDAFRWTEAGGLELVVPAGSVNGGVGSFVYGVSPDGSTLAGSRSQTGATIWQNSLNPTATLPVPNVTSFGGEPGVRGSASDVVLDQFGNAWSSGGYGVIWRNDQIVYQEEFDLSFNSSAGLAVTQDGIRVIVNGTYNAPVAGLLSTFRIVDFADADPSQISVQEISFKTTNISTDGNVVLGVQPNGFISPPFRDLMIWEENADLWGVEGTASVRNFLLDNISPATADAFDLSEWSFVRDESAVNQLRDIAMYRDGDFGTSAILSRGFNPDGVEESFLVFVTAVPEPSSLALAVLALCGLVFRRTFFQTTKISYARERQ